jgi:hypothetical protein
MSPDLADRQIEAFEKVFPVIPETPDIYPAWKALVATCIVIGKQVHDARVAAICQVHRLDQIMTFNVSHFARFAAAIPGLLVLDPKSL